MKYYPKPVEAFQINNNDNTEMIEYFQQQGIVDFDVIHGKLGHPKRYNSGCAVMANGVSYGCQYGQWVVEEPPSFYGINIITDEDFNKHYFTWKQINDGDYL
jgi:hypothetical protein